MSCRLYSGMLLLVALACIGLFALTGCGDKEPAQRAAFIALLESKVVAAKSATLVDLSPAEQKALGDYAGQYALLLDFQKDMTEATANNTKDMLALNKLDSLEAITKEQRSLPKAASEAQKLQKTIAELRRNADKARARLKQPPDLEKVYTAAYDKIVRVPAQTSEAVFTAVHATFTAILDLLDFVDTHGRDLEISGQTIKVINPALQQDLDTRMNKVHKESRLLHEAYIAQINAMRE